VFFDVTAASVAGAAGVIIKDAAGRVILPLTTSIADAGPFTLAGGAYTIAIGSEAGGASSYAFVMRDVVDGVGPIAIGGGTDNPSDGFETIPGIFVLGASRTITDSGVR
jgi:hypothetical protein